MRVYEKETWPSDPLYARTQPFTPMLGGLGAVSTGPGEIYIMAKLKKIEKKWLKLQAYPISDVEGLKKMIAKLGGTSQDASFYLPEPKKDEYIKVLWAAVEKQESSYVDPVRISSSKNRIKKQMVQLKGTLMLPMNITKAAGAIPPGAVTAPAVIVPTEPPATAPPPQILKKPLDIKKIAIGAGIAAVVAGIIRKYIMR